MKKIDVKNSPFSRLGSYMCFSELPEDWGFKGLVMRTMRAGAGFRELFTMSLLEGDKEKGYEIDTMPSICKLKSKRGEVEIVFTERDCLRIRGNSSFKMLSVPITGQYAFPLSESSWQINSAPTSSQYLVTLLSGSLKMKSDRDIGDHKRAGKKRPTKEKKISMIFEPGEDGFFEFAMEEFLTTPRNIGLKGDFASCAAVAKADWKSWLSTMPSVPEKYSDAAKLAMYVNYESTIGAGGHLKCDTMLMSKNWMNCCWSWDHCFNAIALAYKNPDLAWDQLNVHFDLQDDAGCLPDGVNALNKGWNFCKPPIHGWTLSRMVKNKKLLTPKRLKTFYPKLKKWTEWWLKKRDHDRDGLPEYHHGNDSGWDNASVFDSGFPVAAPDLAAFLILQMDLLASLAKQLGKASDSKMWKNKANSMLETMLEKLWDGKQFQSKRAFSGKINPKSDSLINFIPIVLGKRLPKKIRDAVAKELKTGGRFVTRFGPATENPGSPCYVESGYWRGPIWPPAVLLIVDGLVRGGYQKQAKDMARKYCEMCRKSMTFAENYDPLTGEPLCDKAYTWGSSVFLTLAHEFMR